MQTNTAVAKKDEYDIDDMLIRVKDLILETVVPKEKYLREMAGYFLSNQGKMLRPTLTLGCGLIDSGESKVPRAHLYQVAAAVEMLHMSALVHDDILDKSTMRRGKPSVNAMYGEDMALLLGDYFYSRALKLFSGLPQKCVIDRAIDTIALMAEGEVKQKREAHDYSAGIKDYIVKINRKTASLTALSCYAGARVAGLPTIQVNRLTKFGSYFGKAYQIRDDIMDFLQKEDILKKPSSDFSQGLFTLPVILYLKKHGATAFLLTREELFYKCKNSPSVEQASMVCNRYLSKAKDLLKFFPNGVINQKIKKIVEKTYIHV